MYILGEDTFRETFPTPESLDDNGAKTLGYHIIIQAMHDYYYDAKNITLFANGPLYKSLTTIPASVFLDKCSHLTPYEQRLLERRSSLTKQNLSSRTPNRWIIFHKRMQMYGADLNDVRIMMEQEDDRDIRRQYRGRNWKYGYQYFKAHVQKEAERYARCD